MPIVKAQINVQCSCRKLVMEKLQFSENGNRCGDGLRAVYFNCLHTD